MCVWQILSHFPVEAAAITLGNVTNVNAAIQDLRQRLNELKGLLNLTEVREVEKHSYLRTLLFVGIKFNEISEFHKNR
jgi:hypothetical protein